MGRLYAPSAETQSFDHRNVLSSLGSKQRLDPRSPKSHQETSLQASITGPGFFPETGRRRPAALLRSGGSATSGSFAAGFDVMRRARATLPQPNRKLAAACLCACHLALAAVHVTYCKEMLRGAADTTVSRTLSFLPEPKQEPVLLHPLSWPACPSSPGACAVCLRGVNSGGGLTRSISPRQLITMSPSVINTSETRLRE